MLSKRCRRKGPHLALTGESRGLSRVAVGGLGFLSLYHGELREPLMFPQGSQVSIRVVRGLSGFLWSWCRQLGPHLKLRWETQGSSPALTGILGSLWRFP